MLRTLVSSQPQCAETRYLEDLTIQPLPNNGLHRGASLAALFRLSGVMLHVIYIYKVL
jgi:hypothetical protein